MIPPPAVGPGIHTPRIDDVSFARRDNETTIRPGREEFLHCDTVEKIADFVRHRDSLPPDLRCFVHRYSEECYRALGARVFLACNERGGYAIIGDELVSVFSLPGAKLGDCVVEDAIARGATVLCFMDAKPTVERNSLCFPGKLYSLYARHGFVEVERCDWVNEHAHPEWDYAAWGTPDLVTMRLGGASRE